MNGLAARSLLVSVPGAQLAGVPLPGSVFAWRDLRDAPLAPELRLALELVVHAAAAGRVKLRFVARPEIFTHGAARAWLDARIGDAADHLILTDGDSLRTLPGLANHLFFYARGLPKQEDALRRLLSVAPELFAGLASQVNGSLSFRLGARWIRPAPRMLRFAATPAVEPPLMAPFLCHPGNPAKAAALLAEAAEAEEAPPAVGRLHLVPLSASALADPAFLAWLAPVVQRAALGAGEGTLLLGLPAPETAEAEPEDRIAGVLRALAGTGLPFPRAISWAVRCVTAPPAAPDFAGGTLTLHPGIAFWRFGADLLEAAGTVQVTGGGSLAHVRDLVAGWAGREVALLRPAAPGQPVTIGCAP